MIYLSKSAYANNASVQHPIILLEGRVSTQLADHIQVCNDSSNSIVNWPVVSCRFKLLVRLKPGANVISLRHGYYSSSLQYTLSQRQSSYAVQPIYIISRDGDGRYQAPPGVDNSQSAAVKRISLGAALLQTFTASNLQTHNHACTTFQLPLDDSGFPLCKVFRSKYSTEEMFAMTVKELWRNIARELMESADMPARYTSKFLGFISCSRYDGADWNSSWRHSDIVAATKGHVALGE